MLLLDDMKGAIYQAASTKEYLKQEVTCTIMKRKRENLAWLRHTRRCLFEGKWECLENFFSEVYVLKFKDFDDNCNDHMEDFLELASEEKVKDCF